jgi:hypothetical protein
VKENVRGKLRGRTISFFDAFGETENGSFVFCSEKLVKG